MRTHHPIRIIAGKEYLSTFRDRTVILLAVVTWLLLGVAAYSGYEGQRQAAADRAAADSLFRQEWEHQEANPHSAAHFGTYLFKPGTALSAYDPGLNRYLGVSYRVEAHRQHEVSNADAEASGSQLRFGELSAGMVFQLLLPLLIVIITFDTITGERQGGSLRLLLVQGITTRQLIWGKVLGKYTVVLSILLPALLVMAIPIFVKNSGDNQVRYGLLAAAYLVYAFVFTGIGVLCSAWSAGANTALVTAISLWFLLAVLLPKLSARVIDRQETLPDRYELNRSIAEGYSKGLDNEGSARERYEKYLKSTLNKYGVDSVNQLPLNFDGLSMQYGEDYNTRVYEHFSSRTDSILHRQEVKLAATGLLTPFTAIRQLSMGLAGTDYHHHRAFHHQAKKYRDDFIRTLNMQLANSGSAHLSYDYKVGPDFFRNMKDFAYRAPQLQQALSWNRAAWAALGMWLLVIFLLINLAGSRLLKASA